MGISLILTAPIITQSTTKKTWFVSVMSPVAMINGSGCFFSCTMLCTFVAPCNKCFKRHLSTVPLRANLIWECESLACHSRVTCLHVVVYLALQGNTNASKSLKQKYMNSTNTYSLVSDRAINLSVLLPTDHQALASYSRVTRELLVSHSRVYVKLALSGTVHHVYTNYTCTWKWKLLWLIKYVYSLVTFIAVATLPW